jgi:YD repeat-containing protein
VLAGLAGGLFAWLAPKAAKPEAAPPAPAVPVDPHGACYAAGPTYSCTYDGGAAGFEAYFRPLESTYMTYGADGRLVEWSRHVNGPDGRTTSTYYDAAGRVLRVVGPEAPPAPPRA